MNDLLYYGPLADLLETDATYQKASEQTKFGYLTLLASFHWNLVKLLGNVSPQYKLAPAQAPGSRWLVKLPYLDEALMLHIEIGAPSPNDWLAFLLWDIRQAPRSRFRSTVWRSR